MKRAMFLLFLLLAAPLAAPAFAEASAGRQTPDEIIKEGREKSQVMDHLDVLVNQIGPRLTSSDNLTKACEWTRDRFKGYGLDANIEQWGDFPVGFNRGPWSGLMIRPELRRLTFCTPSWTPGTDGPVTGEAIMSPTSEEEIDVAKLKGKWILQENRPRRDLRKKLEAAFLEAGIAGVIHKNRAPLIVTSGNHRISFDNLPKLVTIDMMSEDFDAITAQIEAGKEPQLTIAIQNEFKKGPIPLYNVIADLKGTEKPDEYVVVGGHIDSWDGARGCVDNGTGCATTIEAARILTALGAKPKRTIRFMLWSGEEQGLLGSMAYVRKHRDEMEKYSACLVHDGGTNYVSGINATEPMVPIFEKIFAPVLELDKEMPFKISATRSIAAMGASDHASFIAGGVPGFFWNQNGRSNYTYAHHTQHDLIDMAVPEYQRHTAIVVAIAALGIANLDEKLPRSGVGGGREIPERRMLGVNLDGATVTGVVDESAADKAGLRDGDVLVELDGMKIEDTSSLRSAIDKAHKKCVLVITRDGQRMELSVEFEK